MPQDFREFQVGGPSHLIAIASSLILAGALIWLHLRTPYELWKKFCRTALAIVLVAAALADPPLTLWSFPENPAMGLRKMHETAWPFYLCDIAALTCAAALIWRRQRVAEAAYLWGLGGTVQGLITPTLYYDFPTPQYFAFFIEHGGVPAASLLLALGIKLPPQAGAVWRGLGWGWIYTIAAASINILFHSGGITGANYGFVCGGEGVVTPLDIFGPWPWHLVSASALTIPIFAILCYPFIGWKSLSLKATLSKTSSHR